MPTPTRRYYSSTAVAATLSSSLTSSATSIAISNITGWPTSFPFTAIIGEDTNKEELVTVTNVTGTTAPAGVLTITRNVGGTTGQAHDAGETIRHGVYAQDFEDGSAHYAASTAVHGVAGSVVGTTDNQTLTNKTISGSSNSFSAIPYSAVAQTAWTSWTPTFTGLSGTQTAVGRYVRIGDVIHFRMTVSSWVTTSTTAYFSLPVTPSYSSVGIYDATDVGGNKHYGSLQINTTGRAIPNVEGDQYPLGYTSGLSYSFICSGTYEVA